MKKGKVKMDGILSTNAKLFKTEYFFYVIILLPCYTDTSLTLF